MAKGDKAISISSIAQALTAMYGKMKSSFAHIGDGGVIGDAGEPLKPREEDGGMPLQYQYRIGQNLATSPRDTLTPFETLRSFADSLDLVRIAIEMRKEQIRGLDWDIVNAEGDDKEDYSKDIKAVKNFFRKPNKVDTYYDWIGAVLEDVLVIDALTIYKRRTKKGELFGLDIVDGATIKPLIDGWGRKPLPPLPAYQQIIYGYPQSEFTVDDMIYKPRNRRTSTPYGCSPLEWIIMTVNIALRKQQFTLGYFTEGNMPDGGLYAVPDTWTPDQIKKYQEYWDAMMTGNMASRQKMRFVPQGGYTPTKQFEFQQEFEEWLARLVCTAFQINSQPFLKFTNRATAEVQDDQQTDFGLKPLCLFLEDIFSDVIQNDLGMPHLKFKYTSEKAADEALAVTKNKDYVGAAIYSIDEVRTAEGKEPLREGGLPPYILVNGSPLFLTKKTIERLISESENPPTPPPPSNFGSDGGKDNPQGNISGNKLNGQENKPEKQDMTEKEKNIEQKKIEVQNEVKKWEKFAINRIGKSTGRKFEPSALIPKSLVEKITFELQHAENEHEVKKLFKSINQKIGEGGYIEYEEEILALKKA